MRKNIRYNCWDLKEIIAFITDRNSDLTEVYLFGSRAYDTGSLRSDIDLLIISEIDIPDIPLRDQIHCKFSPVDLFISLNKKSARSMMNGSTLKLRKEYSNIIEQIDAVLLWTKDEGYNESFEKWEQKTLKDIDFKMSIIPPCSNENINEAFEKVIRNLNYNGIEYFFTGMNYNEIANTITELIKTTFIKPSKYAKKASEFSYDHIVLKSEYDFQNLIQMILRPIFKTIEPEPMEIVFNGNKKYADFSISNNKVVIEAKYIDSNSKKNEVLKTLDGLANFYSENPNIKVLIFLILYENNIDLDQVQLNNRYSKIHRDIPIYTEFIENIF